jgi:hypothetical protein
MSGVRGDAFFRGSSEQYDAMVFMQEYGPAVLAMMRQPLALHQAAAQLRVRANRLRGALRELGVQWPRPRKKSRNTAFGTAGRQHTWSEGRSSVSTPGDIPQVDGASGAWSPAGSENGDASAVGCWHGAENEGSSSAGMPQLSMTEVMGRLVEERRRRQAAEAVAGAERTVRQAAEAVADAERTRRQAAEEQLALQCVASTASDSEPCDSPGSGQERFVPGDHAAPPWDGLSMGNTELVVSPVLWGKRYNQYDHWKHGRLTDAAKCQCWTCCMSNRFALPASAVWTDAQQTWANMLEDQRFVGPCEDHQQGLVRAAALVAQQRGVHGSARAVLLAMVAHEEYRRLCVMACVAGLCGVGTDTMLARCYVPVDQACNRVQVHPCSEEVSQFLGPRRSWWTFAQEHFPDVHQWALHNMGARDERSQIVTQCRTLYCE